MKASPNTTAGILLGFLVVASIRPISQVDRALNLAVSPARVVAILASPLGWLRASSYSERNDRLQAEQQPDEELGLSIGAELLAEAMPVSRALLEGRQFVAGRVSGRDRNRKDLLFLEVDDLTGIEPGFPVVHGEAFVGRVVALDWENSTLDVDLVTGADFFVGATVVPHAGSPQGFGSRQLDLIVGGLDRVKGKLEHLAVHNPSERRFRPGMVRVKEPNLFEDNASGLADGFLLGSLTALQGEGGPWSVEPLRNFESGLFHLVVVLPDQVDREPREATPSSLRDGKWLGAKLLSHGDPEAGRTGFVIGKGSLHGVKSGAAVISASRLVGQVDSLRPPSLMSSRVMGIAEPGLTIKAVGRIDEGERRGESKVLGELVSLGARGAGTVAFGWRTSVRMDGLLNLDEAGELRHAGKVHAVLYTGTGIAGIPAGLYLGQAWLPLSADYHEILVTDTTAGEQPSRLFVRVPSRGESKANE